MQTVTGDIHKKLKTKFSYDKRELFCLSDGGEIFLDLQGKRFKVDHKNETNHKNPLMFIVPGVINHS